MSKDGNIGKTSARGRYHATFDPTSEPASDAVVSSLSEMTGTEPDKLESMESIVDPIVFDALVRRSRRSLQFSFVYHEHNVTVDTGGEFRIQPPESSRTAYKVPLDRDESPSYAVIQAIAAVNGVEPTEMPPLHDSIDPDAFEAIFDPRSPSADISRLDWSQHAGRISGGRFMSKELHSSRAFEALSNRYRRQLLLAMFETNPQDDDDLNPLRLLKQGETTEDLDVTPVSLQHVHLPKLADMGFIEWDRESGELSKGPNWEEIAPLLRLMYDHQDELPDEWLSGVSSDE
ncbi:hypothetical protein M0R89_22055 (plasmid) [Halorussus limi]|uniref:ArsR family transcriptional regulator n=1 Tax=Halorussus limi TaxID=2938695 RepID=A0A8U0I224_9EURY|nr:HalOD1 output domain-containing protein [Halorussus limi]UPV77103.1 hypothetical protein M0R89_22055 [Halorussus limi]